MRFGFFFVVCGNKFLRGIWWELVFAILCLNDDKTEFLILGTRQQLAKVNIDNIKVGSAEVTPVSAVRNLGSWFDTQPYQ